MTRVERRVQGGGYREKVEKNKKTGETVGFIRYERCHPDSNWRVMVLQTIALPLGYGTKKMER